MTRILTVADFQPAMDEAGRLGAELAIEALWRHSPHADHCGGYDVLAWPCLVIAPMVDRLTGGAA